MYRPRSIGLLLAFVTLLVYLPATSCQFINYDDPLYITENPVVRGGLTWGGRQIGIHRRTCEQLASAHMAVAHGGL